MLREAARVTCSISMTSGTTRQDSARSSAAWPLMAAKRSCSLIIVVQWPKIAIMGMRISGSDMTGFQSSMRRRACFGKSRTVISLNRGQAFH